MERKLGKKIKVLYTIPNFNTAGSGKALFKIADGLNREIYEPSVMCTHERGELFTAIKNSGMQVHVYNYRSDVRHRLKGLKHCYEVSKYMRTINPDIIHSFNYNDDYSEAISAKLAGTKWIYTKKNMMWNSNAWRLRTFLADGIIALNSNMINDFFKNMKKISLIPRGVDTEEFRVREKPDSLMFELNIKKDTGDKILLCVANFAPVKGIDILLEAFESLSAENKNIKLIICGDYINPYGSEIISKFTRLIETGKLILPGKRQDTKHFYNLADIFILPTNSRGEGTSVSVLEAMASGCVVLASDVAGNRDQLRMLPGQLFKSEAPDLLASKLIEFLSKPFAEISSIQEKQKNIVNEDYSLRGEIAGHEEFYLKILKRRN